MSLFLFLIFWNHLEIGSLTTTLVLVCNCFHFSRAEDSYWMMSGIIQMLSLYARRACILNSLICMPIDWL